MRLEPNIRIEVYRLQNPPSDPGANWGAFMIGPLRIISSGHDEYHGWEHVSVSCENRTPTWDEMAEVKRLFWDDEETVVQFHPARSQYVNTHPYVLHLWRKIGSVYELPPRILIG